MREATGLWDSLPWSRPLHAMAWSWPLCPVYVRSPLSGTTAATGLLKFNALIAAANAFGAFVAAAGGLAIGQAADSFGL